MLRLTRDFQTRQISIRTTGRETVFTQGLLIAFAMALILHLAFFFIFRIAKGRDNYPHLVFAPVTVYAAPQHADSSGYYSLTEYEAQALAKKSTYEPLPSPVTIPPIFSKKIAKVDMDVGLLFKTLETEYLLKELFPLAIEIPIPSVSLHIVGPLQEIAYQMPALPNWEKIVTLPVDQIKQFRYIFDVIVENASGKIIWYERQKPQVVAAHDHSIEELLLLLTFAPNSKGFITKGEIEILVTHTQKMKKND